jgi:hypothetical protein
MVGSFFSVSFASAKKDQWVPEDKVPGWNKMWGVEFVCNETFILLPVESIRIDVWGRGNKDNPNAYTITLAIVNDTNILDAALPENLQKQIDDKLPTMSGGTHGINTIWKLLTRTLPALSGVLKLNYERLDNKKHYYLDDGLMLSSNDVSLTIAKDQDMALFTFAFKIDNQLMKDFIANYDAKVSDIIKQINDFVNQGLTDAGVTATQTTTTALPYDDLVLFIMDQLTGQYGTNNYKPSLTDSIPGYPIAILGALGIVTVGFLLKKRRF